MTELRIIHCGPATSIQDRGRFGWLRFGISRSGAADPLALSAANALVGNPPDTEAIELVFLGAVVEARGGAVRLALAGARMPLAIGERAVAHHTSFILEPGERLVIGPACAGVYAILGIEGGLDIPAELGSKSLHRRAAIGGGNGRPLAPGQDLPLTATAPSHGDEHEMKPLPLDRDQPLRVVLGPQLTHVTAAGLTTFLSSPFPITNEVDRMACRLGGPGIELANGFNIVSDGIAAGSVQVPGSGRPIVMLADRQTVGGYPKIATIITPDLRTLMQRRPGDVVRFTDVTVEEAQSAARQAASDHARITRPSRCLPPACGNSGRLLAINLAGHASSATDPASWQA